MARQNRSKILHQTEILTALTASAIFLVSLSGTAAAASKQKLSTFQNGKPVMDLSCNTLPSQSGVLMGGGKDVKDAFSWMIDQSRRCANPKPGNFVVIRFGGNPSYDSFIAKLGPVASVQTVVVPTLDAANSEELDAFIQNASAIWFTGGDQGDYYNYWKGTRLVDLIRKQIDAHQIPIGGTSAGMMMLSGFNYIAYPNSVTSAQALANPYLDGAMTIKGDFWNSLANGSTWAKVTPINGLDYFVSDSHFAARDRMGRLVAFLARLSAADSASYGLNVPSWNTPRAIGVDQETAILLDATTTSGILTSFKGTTITNPGIDGHSYVLAPATQPVCRNGQAMTFSCAGIADGQMVFNAYVNRMGNSQAFDFLGATSPTGMVTASGGQVSGESQSGSGSLY